MNSMIIFLVWVMLVAFINSFLLSVAMFGETVNCSNKNESHLTFFRKFKLLDYTPGKIPGNGKNERISVKRPCQKQVVDLGAAYWVAGIAYLSI